MMRENIHTSITSGLFKEFRSLFIKHKKRPGLKSFVQAEMTRILEEDISQKAGKKHFNTLQERISSLEILFKAFPYSRLYESVIGFGLVHEFQKKGFNINDLRRRIIIDTISILGEEITTSLLQLTGMKDEFMEILKNERTKGFLFKKRELLSHLLQCEEIKSLEDYRKIVMYWIPPASSKVDDHNIYTLITYLLKNYIRFGYKNIPWEEFYNDDGFKLLSSYKKSGTSFYTGDYNCTGVFSISDKFTDVPLKMSQEGGVKIVINGNEHYYEADGTQTYTSVESQLIVNRIFSPYLPMTRLLRLVNSKVKKIVSIDVNDTNAENILQYDEKIPECIRTLIRWIYQYIAGDGDKYEGHNIENGIIYDFNYALHDFEEKIDIIHKNDLEKIAWSSLTGKEKQDIVSLFFFFREYVIKLCSYNLAKQKLTKDEHQTYTTLKERAESLSALTLGLCGSNICEEDISIMLEIDNSLAKKYET